MDGRTQAKCWDLPPFSTNSTNTLANGFGFSWTTSGMVLTWDAKVLHGSRQIKIWLKYVEASFDLWVLSCIQSEIKMNRHKKSMIFVT